MEGAETRCVRILSSLEDLICQEAAALQACDYKPLDAIQIQAGALLEFLAVQPPAARAGLGERLLALQALRRRTAAQLAQAMAVNRDELRVISGREGLIARVAPAYGTNAGVLRQLSLVA